MKCSRCGANMRDYELWLAEHLKDSILGVYLDDTYLCSRCTELFYDWLDMRTETGESDGSII